MPRRFLRCTGSPFALTDALGYGLLIWLGHRLFAACVFRYWCSQKALPDFGYLAKVVCYENVGFVLALVACAALYVPAGLLASFLRGPLTLIGAFVSAREMRFVVLALVLLLIVFWRYRIIRRAIRWSNF